MVGLTDRGGAELQPLCDTPIWLTSMPMEAWQAWRSIFEMPGESGAVTMNKYWREISQGEPVWVWQSGPEAGIVAAGVTCGEPYVVIPWEGYEFRNPDNLPVVVGEIPFTSRDEFKPKKWIPIDAVKVFDRPLSKTEIIESDDGEAFRALTIIRAPMGSMHKVTPEADLVIRAQLSPEDRPWPPVPLPSIDLGMTL